MLCAAPSASFSDLIQLQRISGCNEDIAHSIIWIVSCKRDWVVMNRNVANGCWMMTILVFFLLGWFLFSDEKCGMGQINFSFEEKCLRNYFFYDRGFLGF